MGEKDINTSNRIKEAAGKLFREKGFGRTTTRDIATEAHVNLALINYYFGSKDKLFRAIMMDTAQGFLSQIRVLLNEDHSFEEKVGMVVSNYIDLLSDRPDLPIFMLSEMRNHPQEMAAELGVAKMLHEATFFKELAQRCPDGVHPAHLFINLLSMTVFPFAAKPLLSTVIGMDNEAFALFMQQRKAFIPQWFLSMLRSSN